MAAGAKALFGEDRKKIQSYFKHRFLQHYAPQFAFKLGARGDAVAIVDGFAGIPFYADGEPGSGPLLLALGAAHPSLDVVLMELDGNYAAALEGESRKYPARPSGRVWAHVVQGDTRANLARVASQYADAHLLLYLDPCGLGIAFNDLVSLVQARARRRFSTELMLNFSSGLVERVGGGFFKSTDSGSALTLACGSDWWVDLARPLVEQDGSWASALPTVVGEFARRLGAATRMHVVTVPIRATPRARPIFSMVCATPSGAGVFALSDSYARAWDDWRDEAARRANANTLFETTDELFVSADAVRDSAGARARLRLDVLNFVQAGDAGTIGHLPQLLAGAVGQLTDAEVGQELRAMANEGLIGLTKNKRPAAYEIYPTNRSGIASQV